MNKNDYLIKLNNYNGFLNPQNGLITNSRYDEPTYLTFRIDFLSVPPPIKTDIPVDRINELENRLNKLIGKRISANGDPKKIERIYKRYDKINKKVIELSGTPNVPPADDVTQSGFRLPEGLLKDENRPYSAYDYLKNSINEEENAELLLEFRRLLEDLKTNFPYYIKSIENVNKLLEVTPKHGSRIKNNTTITLKCMEGLDQRISTLKTLYKKIAWDDEYQRWVLPDIMRFFSMRIYISEFRIFHENKNKTNYDTISNKNRTEIKINAVRDIKNSLEKAKNFLTGSGFELSNDVINKVIPTTIICCEMCEFDIENLYTHYSSLNANDPKSKPLDDIELKIKIGNIKEVIYNGTFLTNTLLIDEANLYPGIDPTNTLYKERTGITNEVNGDVAKNFSDGNLPLMLNYTAKALKDITKHYIDEGDEWFNNGMNNLYNKKIGKGDNPMSINDMATEYKNAMSLKWIYDKMKGISKDTEESYKELGRINSANDTYYNKISSIDDDYTSSKATNNSLDNRYKEFNTIDDNYPNSQIYENTFPKENFYSTHTSIDDNYPNSKIYENTFEKENFYNIHTSIDDSYPNSSATSQSIDIMTFKSFLDELAKNENKTQAEIANILIDYGNKINANSIEDYMEVINTVYEDIENKFNDAIIMPQINQPSEYSLATTQEIKRPKIIL